MKTIARYFSIALLCIASLTIMSFDKGDGGVKLRFNPEPGKSYTVKVISNTQSVINAQGNSITSSTGLIMTTSMRLIDVQDANYNTEWNMSNIKFSQTSMGMTFAYDSEHPEDASPLLSEVVKKYDNILNKPYSITYDSFGRNISQDDKTGTELSGNICILPEASLNVGSVWTESETKSFNDIECSIETSYTVTKITRKEVVATLHSVMSGKQMSGTSDGTATFDINTGLESSSTVTSKIQMTISEQGMTLPISLTETRKTTIE